MATATKTYSMQCSCGDKMQVEAGNKGEATAKLKNMMDETTIQMHYDEKHPGEDVPTVHEVHQMIEQNVEEE